MNRRILVVEDNSDLAQLVSLHLRDLNFDVDIAADGALGLHKARTQQYDLVILDIMLPALDGIEVCKRLRSQMINTPILMLTSKSSELDRVLGLEIGADDYVTKPFSIPELMARVKAIFRRIEQLQNQEQQDNHIPISCNGLLIDTNKRSVTINDKLIELTPKEFDLLVHFAKHPGRVYTRVQLLDQVWGFGHDGYEHTVNSHINRLRAKIEVDANNPKYIQTVWGVGYKFSESQT